MPFVTKQHNKLNKQLRRTLHLKVLYILCNWFMSKPLDLAGNFTYHIGLDMVIDIFPVSSAQILKPINNAAMSLTSIQKNINSLSPHQLDLYLRPHTSGVPIFRVCILHVFMHEVLAEINKMVTSTSHVFAMKRLQHTA